MSGTVVLCYEGPDGTPIAVSAANPMPSASSGGPAFIEESEKGQPNGVATLGADGKVPNSELPPLQHDVGKAANEAGMLALNVTAPAMCLREDFTPPHIFFLTADPASTLANWTDTGELGGTGANPTAKVGLAAVNGVSTSYMRADGAPALDEGITPTWTGAHVFAAPLSFTGNSPWTLGGTTGVTGQALMSSGNATQPTWTTVAAIVGGSSRTAQATNVSVANFYTVAVGGLYRVSAYVVLSQAATTSSTMPSASISYTEAVTGANVQDMITTTATNNTVGLHSGGSVVIQAQQGSNLSFITSNYASVGATPMQYSVHLTVERIS